MSVLTTLAAFATLAGPETARAAIMPPVQAFSTLPWREIGMMASPVAGTLAIRWRRERAWRRGAGMQGR